MFWLLRRRLDRDCDLIVDMTVKRMNREHIKDLDGYPEDLMRSIAISALEKLPIVTDAAFVSGLDDYLEPEGVEHLGKG
jgi:hypothetical protein